MKKVLIIGGEGFIGWHIVGALNRSNRFEVELLSRSPKTNPFPDLKLHEYNIWQSQEVDVIAFLSNYDYVVFAGGSDERVPIVGKASDFFYEANVVPCKKLVSWAEKASVQKVIILGSYFTTLNRNFPQWEMAKNHPYVASRVAQQQESIAASSGNTSVVVLELPYIFGSVPHKIPLWKPLIDYVKSSYLVFYTNGGTNMVAVETVANAVLGAIDLAKHGDCLFVGDENWTWKQMLDEIAQNLQKTRKIITIPDGIVLFFARIYLAYLKIFNKEFGLNPVEFIKTQTEFTFLDAKQTQQYLKYDNSDLSIAVARCVKRSIDKL
ncbi:MAG: NAD-dependent epimerase/dehydratase family protein [Emticicia sp.]|nr:NAD-dependent epimerase/dehydratase family protein [Emticicia sp.]